MDGFCPEPSEGNDHKEKTSRRRRSSILKPPRSPLQDIRSGNEIGQDFITTRSRKSSRRVSFAETIKVFQTEIPTDINEEAKNTGIAVGENVPFKQDKTPEDNQCEIIGMETLLHAPLQAQLQQSESSDIEPTHEKKYGNDQTVIFSDENQMDLTASHTVMITKGLLSCPQIEKPSKIDTKSFLANLKSHNEDLPTNKEFNLPTDPERRAEKCPFQSKTNTSSENKVNFNDFIKRLKLEKSISAYVEGPDKENVFTAHIPSQEPSNNDFSLLKKSIFPSAEENIHNVTRLFREQGDRKDITQSHTDDMQTTDPLAKETLLKPVEGCDLTVCGNDSMDLTVNHTAQNFLPTNNKSGIENHTQSITVDVTKGGYTTENPRTKRICRKQLNISSQGPSGNLENGTGITRSHIGVADTQSASQTSNQGSVTLPLVPEPACSGLVLQGDKTVFFSSNDDALEMTKSLTPQGDDKNAHVINLTQMYPNSANAMPSLTDKTVYSEEANMDITESDRVSTDDHIIELCLTNMQVPSLPNLENELVFQDQETVSGDIKQNKSCRSVSYVTREGLHQGLADPLSTSLSGNKSVVLSGEDMDLTKCCTVKIDSSDLGTLLPLTSTNVLAPVKTKNPLSLTSSLHTWEEMEITKSHTVPINLNNKEINTQQELGPKNTQTEICMKDEKILEFSSCPDKDSLHSSVYNRDMNKSHIIGICGESLDRKVALGNFGNAHFHKQPLLSKVKPITLSSEDDMERHTININPCTLKSTLGQNFKLSDPLEKNINTSLAFCHDKTLMFSEEQQNMDLTTSHTAVIGCMHYPSEQKSGDVILQNIIYKPQSELQNNTNLLSNLSDMGFVGNYASTKQIEESSIINTRSFLANLKSHNEDLPTNKEFNLPTDSERTAEKCSFQSKTNTSSENKVNFNDFIKRLKLEKSISAYVEGPDKENVFTAHIPSQEPSNNDFSLLKKSIFPSAEENIHNVTRLFREQGDRKDITQSHTDDMQTTDPLAKETLLKPVEGCDLTVCGNDSMDLTVNHTAQNFLPTNNKSGIENHTQSITVDVTKGGYTTENPRTKRICRKQLNISSQGPSGNLENGTGITRSHIGVADTQSASQTSNQGSVTLPLVPEPACSGLVLQGDKTVFFSSNDDALEMTKSLTPQGDDKNAHVINLTQMYPNSANAMPSLTDKTVYSEEANMDITESDRVSTDDHIIELCLTNMQVPSLPNLENELVFQDQETVSGDIKQNKSCRSVSYVTREGLHQGLADPLSTSLSGNKSVVLSGEDMDLTKCCTVKIDSSDLGTLLPLTSTNVLAPVKTKNPLSLSSRPTSQTALQHIPFPPKQAFNSFLQGKSDLQSEKPFGNCQNSLSQPENHRVANTDVSPENVHQSLLASSLLPCPSEKTIIFAPEQDNMDLTENHEVIIQTGNPKIPIDEQKQKYNEASMRHGKSPNLTLSSLNKKGITEIIGDSLEINKIHTIVRDKADLGDEGTSRPTDKTVLFSDNQDELEITKSHSVLIDYQTTEKTQNISLLKDSSRKSLGQPKMMFARNDQTIFFSEEGENDLDLTKSHTTVINSQIVPQEDSQRSVPIDKTIMFTSSNDMELTKPIPCMINKTVERPRLENAQLLGKPERNKSMNEFYSNKTVVSPAGNENEMEITKELNHKDVLVGEQDSCLIPLAAVSKTVLYRGEQDDMELTNITKSHMFAMDCEANLHDEGTSRLMDKTVVFADNQDELEITKSHTVVIDYQTMEKTQDRTHLKDSKRKSLSWPKMMFAPNDQTVFFSEEDGNDLDLTKSHTIVINSQIVPQGDNHRNIPVDKSIIVTSSDDMELATCMTNKMREDPVLNTEHLSEKPGENKSINVFNSDKTVLFSADDENDMEITNAYTKEVNNKGLLEGEQDRYLVPLATASKTILYRGEQDDMEITNFTKSHTFAMDCEANLQDEGTSRLMDKTVMFADNQDELEITKSHTVVIDYQTMEKTQDRTHLKDSKRKSLGQPKMMFAPNDQTVFFSEEGGNDLDLTKSHTRVRINQRVPQGDEPNSIPKDRTVMFTSSDDMELTKLTTCITDKTIEDLGVDIVQPLEQPSKKKSINKLNSDKTVVFSGSDDNEMEITNTCTMEINHKDVLGVEQDRCLVPLVATSKAVLSRGEQDDMEITDITKSHRVAMDCEANLHDEGTSRLMDKTVVFADNQDELEITKSHTVVIDYQTMEKTQDRTHLKDSKRKSLSWPKMMFAPNDQTVFFSEEGGNDLDLTKSHTRVRSNQRVPQGDEPNSIPKDRTIMFTSSDDMELTKLTTCITDKTIEDLGVDIVQPLEQPSKKKSINKLNSDKTVVFSGSDDNEMEITNTCTMEISHKDVLGVEQDKCLVPLVATSKAVLSRGEQDDMELTDIIKSHTVAMDCEANLQDLGTCRLMDKTVMFADNQDELEITKSHTVVIDYQVIEKTQDMSYLKGSRRKSLGQPKMMFAPNDQTVFFSEEDGNDLDLTESHTTVINSQVVPQGDSHRSVPINKTVMFTSNNDMELTELTPCTIDKLIERSNLGNTQLLDKPGGSKSMNELYSNKTVIFLAGDEDEMEITNVLTKEINPKDVLGSEQDRYLVPLTTASKTILYRGEQDDMENTDITKNHTFAVDHEADLQNGGTSRIMDKTVVFTDNQGELEITKAHTVVIDSQTMKNTQNIFPDKTKLDSFKINNLVGTQVTFIPNNETIFLSCEDVNDRKITKKQIDAIENKSFLQNKQQQSALSFFPVDKTMMFTGDQDKMEMDRSQSSIIKEKTWEKVVDQDQVLETTIRGSYPFESTILLGKISKIKSKTIPFKFPQHKVKNFTSDEEQRRSKHFRDALFIDPQSQSPTHLPEKEQYIVNRDKLMQPESENGNLKVATESLCIPNYENESRMLHDDRKLTTVSEKEQKQNVSVSKRETTVEIHVNSDSATQEHQPHAIPSKLSDPMISSKAISTANIEPNLNNDVKRSENFQTTGISNLTEQLPKLGKQAEDTMNKSHSTETQNTKTGTNDPKNDKDEVKLYSCIGDTSSVFLKAVEKNKIKARKYSLGIFLPKLPNKRNCSVTGMNALEHISGDLTDGNSLETQLVNNKNSNLICALKKPPMSPSQYINEELIPLDPEESNSSESISIEIEEKASIETCQQKIQPPESTAKEISNSQKRLRVKGDDDSVHSEKKVRKDEASLSHSTQALQAFDHPIEEYVDKNSCDPLTKNLNRTPSSCSSSSDSIKADGTSINYSIQQSSQMESQFLMDHNCEESLKEKLHDGRITVREFFTLLQVHILIQKPRHSTLPANFATNVSSTPKDLMLNQYVYRPQIQIYKEDCQALHEKIEELKLRALNQDKLLVDVNRSLWEVMKDCSDEELKTFGVHLNKMKSRFAKKTKVFAHQGKVALYSKLVQSAKAERENLEIRMDKMDSVLKEADTCLAALDLEIKNLDKIKEIPMEEWDSEILATEKELEQLQAKEEELKRNISELEIQRQQAFAQINILQTEANTTKERLEKFNGSEWEIIEWSDSQAVFTFLYDSIELTITFGEPVDGPPFLNKICRKIVGVNFETLLNENKAPPSSLLVHRLILQFIKDQESWKNKCITQHHVPKMLQEISLVVSHCRLLGEEIEYLSRWGPKFNLMNVDVNNTQVQLLFSSSAAFAKFELTLSLSAHYPSVPVSFTIQNLIGNTAQDKIAAILSKVPLDNNYLKTAVKYIYQDLLQGPHIHP
ncbi:kinetochore scaffold 1 isoform X2 [Monodelphis domestica]|nr:kinetochore scaffold 1 isoform X2 [Monodelphis domestica]XP_056666255.1 kinetochore scaffold 1 isoform X2 [Monodelphis domestica]XP_056666256.1 kinetochore scaffold 1 isoform X2 [Monodelphis domestica]